MLIYWERAWSLLWVNHVCAKLHIKQTAQAGRRHPWFQQAKNILKRNPVLPKPTHDRLFLRRCRRTRDKRKYQVYGSSSSSYNSVDEFSQIEHTEDFKATQHLSFSGKCFISFVALLCYASQRPVHWTVGSLEINDFQSLIYGLPSTALFFVALSQCWNHWHSWGVLVFVIPAHFENEYSRCTWRPKI